MQEAISLPFLPICVFRANRKTKRTTAPVFSCNCIIHYDTPTSQTHCTYTCRHFWVKLYKSTLSFCPSLLRKRGDIGFHSSVRLSVSPSVCHKNFNLSHNFWTIKDRAFIFHMYIHNDQVLPFILMIAPQTIRPRKRGTTFVWICLL